tara:strand:+ start:12202 stop:13785 length:1584 start_codon:yes stop_codon:yes gene_type:complete
MADRGDQQIELDAGFVDFSLPIVSGGGFLGKIGSYFLIFIVILSWISMLFTLPLTGVLGIYIDNSENYFGVLAFSFCGIISGLIVAFASPTELAKQLHKIRTNSPPRDFTWRKESGGVELENFWNSATVRIPSQDDRGWVFEAPGPENWQRENQYEKDETGIIDEHPRKVGTPRPATISSVGIAGIVIAILLSFSIYAIADYSTNGWECDNGQTVRIILAGGEDEDGNPTGYCSDRSDYGLSQGSMYEDRIEDEFPGWWPITYGYAIFALIWIFVAYGFNKRMTTIIDTTTDLVRSVAVGNSELVGQVRQHLEEPMSVVVDGDPSKTVDDLYLWHWTYEIYVCRKVKTKDGWQERCNWETVRSKRGGEDFILHDGTGGIVVRPKTWDESKVELGQYLIQWECAHDLSLKGLFTSLAVSGFGGSIKRHKWTMYGIKIGDPIYLTGEIRNRSDKELKKESINPYKDRTRKSASLEVVGKNSPALTAYLERGSELGALSGTRSSFDYLIPPGLAIASSMMILTIWKFAIF